MLVAEECRIYTWCAYRLKPPSSIISLPKYDLGKLALPIFNVVNWHYLFISSIVISVFSLFGVNFFLAILYVCFHTYSDESGVFIKFVFIEYFPPTFSKLVLDIFPFGTVYVQHQRHRYNMSSLSVFDTYFCVHFPTALEWNSNRLLRIFCLSILLH